MQNRKVLIPLIIALIFLACQPTPTGDIVINKGEGVLEQRILEARERDRKVAQAPTNSAVTSPTMPDKSFDASDFPSSTPDTVIKDYEYPAHWHYFMELPNFQITIDTDVSVKGNRFPVTRLKETDFRKQEDSVSRLLTGLISDAQGMRDGVKSYEDYRAECDQIALGVFDFDKGKYVPYSSEERKEAETQIADLAREMANARLENDFDAFLGFRTKPDTETTYRTGSGEIWYVTISETSFSATKGKTYPYPESRFINDPVQPGQPAPTPYQDIVISETDAVAAVETFLRSTLSDEWSVMEAARAAVQKPFPNLEEGVLTDAQGFLITCSRKISGQNLFQPKSLGSARIQLEEALYSAPLKKEQLQIFVNEDGIYGLWWNDPLEVVEKLTEQIELLPFETIQNNVVENLKIGHSWAADHKTRAANGELPPTRKGRVYEMELTYTIIQERNNSGYYLMVPTWVISYQTENAMNSQYLVSPYYLAVNAIDGSRIQLSF